MKIITAVRGFKDILPGESEKWQYVEAKAREIFGAFGFREIVLPILEKTELFKRSIGETTDIVEKEMYTFVDRGDESLTMRPEATASVMRAYLEHGLYASESLVKLYTIGPMFRRERPQKGRFRQFNQLNAELLGSKDPRVDAEVILMLVHFLRSVGVADARLEVNSLGCPACRPAFRDVIRSYLAERQDGLCEDCRRRLSTNPLRVFDCKVDGCRAVVASAPLLIEFLCSECRGHFDEVQACLRRFETPFEVNARMVRGLDYYTKTAFEVTTGALGAQNAIAGGGRYDRLVEDLGGPESPGIGFAVGLERLVAVAPIPDEKVIAAPDLFIAALGKEAQDHAFVLCNRLRMKGVLVETDYGARSLKSQMKRSDRLKCRYTLILGERELQEKKALLRDMKDSTQQPVGLDDAEKTILRILAKE
ncbi:MAG TPA: histidine--tRNA ligase [Syntrophales bacterium]|nr:histidine--tRNA ligase [Syntrophales bacterium]